MSGARAEFSSQIRTAIAEARDGKVSVSYQGWDATRTVLDGQRFVISWGPQGMEGRIIDAHPRMFADLQDDSIFHPRTWHRAARLGTSASIASSAGCAVGARGRMTLVSRLGQYDLVDTGRNFRVSGQPFEKRGDFGCFLPVICEKTCPCNQSIAICSINSSRTYGSGTMPAPPKAARHSDTGTGNAVRSLRGV